MNKLGLCGFILALGACGDRPGAYDAPIAGVKAFGLENDVALVDDAAHRVVLLAPSAEQGLERTMCPGGTACTMSVPRASAMRWRSSTLA